MSNSTSGAEPEKRAVPGGTALSHINFTLWLRVKKMSCHKCKNVSARSGTELSHLQLLISNIVNSIFELVKRRPDGIEIWRRRKYRIRTNLKFTYDFKLIYCLLELISVIQYFYKFPKSLKTSLICANSTFFCLFDLFTKQFIVTYTLSSICSTWIFISAVTGKFIYFFRFWNNYLSKWTVLEGETI